MPMYHISYTTSKEKKKKKRVGGGFNKERRIKRSELYDFISLRVVYR
jgi:hypothetical protein